MTWSLDGHPHGVLWLPLRALMFLLDTWLDTFWGCLKDQTISGIPHVTFKFSLKRRVLLSLMLELPMSPGRPALTRLSYSLRFGRELDDSEPYKSQVQSGSAPGPPGSFLDSRPSHGSHFPSQNLFLRGCPACVHNVEGDGGRQHPKKATTLGKYCAILIR